MLALISPAKKLDFESDWDIEGCTQPELLDETAILADQLRDLSSGELQRLMKLSDSLGELNYQRYQCYSTPFTAANARPALLAFRGDTYVGLDADCFSAADRLYAQDHLRILSGFYGLLRPLDLMQAYRLEMGTKLSNVRGESLYDFWGDLIAQACNDAVQGHADQTVISLASNEYMKAVRAQDLCAGVITCHFKEMKNGIPKTIGLFAKRARGMMARYMVQNRVESPEGLKGFAEDGYVFDSSLSDDSDYVFVRDSA